MSFILYSQTGTSFNSIWELPPSTDPADYAASQGWVISEWAEVDTAVFGDSSVFYPQSFTLVDNSPSPSTLTFDLSSAKEVAKGTAKANTASQQSSALAGYTAEVLAAQAVLPEVSRTPEIQASIDAVNVLNDTLQANLAAIDSATDINEVNNIVNPPTGILFTGRGSGLGPEDLNVSYYVEFTSASLDQSQTELYVPGTDTVIPYVIDIETGQGSFDSAGNCFNPGDYLIQIRQVSNSFVIAEFEVPLNPTGEDVAF